MAGYGGGSRPADQAPSLTTIRQTLAVHYQTLRDYVAKLSDEDLKRMTPGPGGKDRSVSDAIHVLTWHEAHHQGQMHLTWNLYKSAHGVAG